LRKSNARHLPKVTAAIDVPRARKRNGKNPVERIVGK